MPIEMGILCQTYETDDDDDDDDEKALLIHTKTLHDIDERRDAFKVVFAFVIRVCVLKHHQLFR